MPRGDLISRFYWPMVTAVSHRYLLRPYEAAPDVRHARPLADVANVSHPSQRRRNLLRFHLQAPLRQKRQRAKT